MHQAALASFFFRFFLHVSQHLPSAAALFPADFASGADGLPARGLPEGLQHYKPAPPGQLVGNDRVHLAAQSQVKVPAGSAAAAAAHLVRKLAAANRLRVRCMQHA